jgi:hypothetical protein
MPISVTCPECARAVKAPAASAGRKVKCPECGAAVRVPDQDEAAEDTPRRKRKRKAKKTNPALWVGVGVGALAVVAVVVVVIILIVNANKPASTPTTAAGGGGNQEKQGKEKGKGGIIPLGDKKDPAGDGVLEPLENGTNIEFEKSKQKLKQLGQAMHNYETTRTKFPGAAILSRDGKKTPLLSWRVAILPYLEQDNLFNQFKLDEPWDSDHNKKLIKLMPEIYQPVRREHPDGGRTYYQVLTGKRGPFGEGREPRVIQFSDGTSNTFLIVEGDRPVVWTKPEDLEYDIEFKGKPEDQAANSFKFKNGVPVTKIGGMFANGFCAVMADGRPEKFSREIPAWKIHALITHNGGELFNLVD